MRVSSIVLLLSIGYSAYAASCGGSGVPFRFEVLPSGTPVLGCGTPQCFGADRGGSNVLHDSKFNAGPDGEDGFFREGDLSRSRSRFAEAPAQQAECPISFDSQSCVNPLTWVGGFQHNQDGSLRLQCCQYTGLRFAAEVGRPIVHAGEVYSGGEVLRDGRQTGFDLISNIKKIESQDGSIAYELTVTRMNCLPDPPEGVNDVGLDSSNDIGRILDKVGEVQQSPPVDTRSSDPSATRGADSAQFTGNSIQQGGDSYVQQPQPQGDAGTDQYVQVGEQVVPVTEAGYYYPVASGIPACFTEDTVINTPNGEKTMKDLKIGDLVMTANDNGFIFTEVSSFMHRLPEVEAYFVQLKTEKNTLKLTPQHFIYKVDCSNSSMREMIYAENMKVGDCLLEDYQNEEQPLHTTPVVSISTVKQTGVYAPMTASGDILVNNIYASCHNVVKSSTLSHTFLNAATYMQNAFRSLFSLAESAPGHLPSTSEFFLQMIDYIIPHKM